MSQRGGISAHTGFAQHSSQYAPSAVVAGPVVRTDWLWQRFAAPASARRDRIGAGLLSAIGRSAVPGTDPREAELLTVVARATRRSFPILLHIVSAGAGVSPGRRWRSLRKSGASWQRILSPDSDLSTADLHVEVGRRGPCAVCLARPTRPSSSVATSRALVRRSRSQTSRSWRFGERQGDVPGGRTQSRSRGRRARLHCAPDYVAAYADLARGPNASFLTGRRLAR